ncbi:MAG: hypothetical protein K0R00_2090 [Herbinix sp.]|nr:hypothetical protein [Herbinix sp.]
MTNFKYLYNFIKYFKIYCRENIFSNVIKVKVDNLTKTERVCSNEIKKDDGTFTGGNTFDVSRCFSSGARTDRSISSYN